MKSNCSKKISLQGNTINSTPIPLDGGAVPKNITGTSNYPWLVSELKKLGYVYSKEESIANGLAVFVMSEAS